MPAPAASSGPLAGIRVVELASIGPGPFCAMLLADLGADVVRLERVGGAEPVGPAGAHAVDVVNRGRRSIGIDLKAPGAAEVVLELCGQADVLIEGMRPGVAERLGVGPDAARARNDRLVYGRMTGWGQDGPRASEVGHDIDYIALAGALGMLGPADGPPVAPMNLVGDYGGGGMLLALGVLAALLERGRSGSGQVVDAAMVDGAALLLAPILGWVQAGGWPGARGTNMLDGGAPFYRTYACADGRFVAVGAIEPRFYADLLDLLGLADADLGHQLDQARWPATTERFAAVIAQRARDEWTARAAGREACLAPVLAVDELADDPHLAARGTVVRRDGLLQPAPAPRFDRTPAALGAPPPAPGEHTRAALADWGLAPERVDELVAAGVVG